MKRAGLIARAKELGIKNPEAMDRDALGFAVGTCISIIEIYREAAEIGVSLPPDIEHLGTLRARFADEKKKLLAHVKKDAEIVYRGKAYTVARVGTSPREIVYTLRPKEGGRTITVRDNTLIAGIQQA